MKNDLITTRLNRWFLICRQALLRGRKWLTARLIVVLSIALCVLVALFVVFYNTQQTRAEPNTAPAAAVQHIARNTVQNPALQAAINEFQRAIKLEPRNPVGYQYLSQAYQFADLPDAVVGVWEQAARANRRESWPHLELGAYYELEKRYREASAAYGKALTVAPADEQALMAVVRLTKFVAAQTIAQNHLLERVLAAEADEITGAAQFVPATSSLANGWTLIGYYGDERRLLAGSPTPFWLFWLAPQAGAVAGLAEAGWQALEGGVWLHIEQAAANLLPNSGFEAGWQESGPAGFPLDVYNIKPEARQLRVLSRGGVSTTVGVLENDIVNQLSSLMTDPLPINAQQAYLLTGWFRSWQARAYASVQWVGDIPAPYAAGNDMVAADTLARWHRVTGVAEPPPGSTQVQVQLLNYQSSGQAFFDDITLIAVAKPGMASAPARQQLVDAYRAHPAIVEDEAWMMQVAAVGPSQRVNQSLDNGWTFAGYHTDEARLAAGEPAILWAFWQGPDGATPGATEDGWYALAPGSWLQIVNRAVNVIPNGGFERRADNGAPAGFPRDIYRAVADMHQQAVVERNGLRTAVGSLANSATVTATSFATNEFQINPHKLYLQTGWILSQGGNAFLGRNWPDAPPATATFSYSFVVAGEQAGVWRHYAGIAIPPAGSTRTQIWLLNNNSTGQVYFDDVTFVPLDRPGAGASQ